MKSLELSEEFRAAFETGFAFPVGTVTAATTDLISRTAHTLSAGDRVRFTTTTTLPAGLAVLTDYYVLATDLTANAFKVSATNGGTAVNITDTGTGTHTVNRCVAFLNDLDEDGITLPSITFKVEDKPQNGIGTQLEYTLTITIDSAADGTTPRAAHAALVALVVAKLHGSGKAALLAAMNTSAAFSYCGWNAADDDAGIASNHFHTTIAATGTVVVI